MRHNRLAAAPLAAGALLAAMLLAAAAAAADTAASPWVETRQTHIRLVAARTAVGAAPVASFGLQIRLDPGWKIYWRSPGDAGIPPQLDWSGSSNLDRAVVRWPVPHRFRLFDLDTFGYTGEIVLPIEARLAKPAAPLALRLKLAYGICRDVCIPYEATLVLALPAGAGDASAFAPLIERFAARVPAEGNAAGLRITAARLRDGPAGRELVVDAASDRPMLAPDLLVEGPAGLSFSAPKTSPGAAPSGLVFRSEVGGPKGIALAGQEVTLTLIDGERAIERHLRLDGAGR